LFKANQHTAIKKEVETILVRDLPPKDRRRIHLFQSTGAHDITRKSGGMG